LRSIGRTPLNVKDKWRSMGEEKHEERDKGIFLELLRGD